MIQIESAFAGERRPTFLIENVLEGAVAVEAGGGDAALASNGATFDFWSPTVADAHIDYTLADAPVVNCLCIAAHDLGTKGATVTLTIGSDVVSTHTPEDDRSIMLMFIGVEAATARIAVSGASGPVNIGVMMLGKSLTLAAGITGDYVPTNWADRVDLLGGTTITGQFLGQRIIRRGGDTRIAPGLIDREWWEANGDPLRVRFNDGLPFFFAGGPCLFPNDIAYCWRSPQGDEMRPAYSNAHHVSFGFEVSFYA